MIVQRMEGAQDLPCAIPLTYKEVEKEWLSSVIDHYADISIRISTLKYDAIGGLDIDLDGNLVVGSDVEFSLTSSRNPTGLHGLFRSLRERFLHIVDAMLDYIKRGIVYRTRPTLAYLVYLEIRRLIGAFSPLAAEETEFYLEHPDSHSGNILLSGSSISGYIDWQW